MNDKKQTPTIHRRETAAKTRIFHIQELDIEFNNGTRVTYERLKSGENGEYLDFAALNTISIRNIKRKKLEKSKTFFKIHSCYHFCCLIFSLYFGKYIPLILLGLQLDRL